LVKENEELQQKIDAINDIADPIQRVENYKKTCQAIGMILETVETTAS